MFAASIDQKLSIVQPNYFLFVFYVEDIIDIMRLSGSLY